MSNKQVIVTLVELQKQGVSIYLTDQGYREFLKLMQQEIVLEEAVS